MSRATLTLTIISMLAIFSACQASCAAPAAMPAQPSTASPTALHTHTAASLPTPTSTASPAIPVPIRTPVATPAAPPTAEPTTFTLQTPDPEQLVSIISSQREQNWYLAIFNGSPDLATHYQLSQGLGIEALIAFDLARYFPAGIPDAGQYLQTIQPGWVGLYFKSSEIIEQLLQAGSAQIMVEHQDSFVPGEAITFPVFDAWPYAVDTDGDQQAEWLVKVYFPDYWVTTWLLLKTDQAGKLISAPTELPFIIHLEPNELSTTVVPDTDVTGDGIQDVVLSRLSYGAGSLSGDVSVFSWSNGSLRRVAEMDLPSVSPRFAETNVSSFELVDPDHDGNHSIQITWPRFAPFGCAWETVFTYTWQTGTFNRIVQQEQPPTTADCLIAKALDSNTPSERVTFLQQALDQLDLGEQPDLESWLRLQLAMALAAQGKDQLAGQALDRLQNQAVGGNFEALVQDVIQTVGNETLAVCQALHQLASERSRLGTALDSELAYFGGYPVSYETDPDLVCPYWDLFARRLELQIFPQSPSPAQAFSEQGYTLLLETPVHRGPQAPATYLGIIPDERDLWLVIEATADGWRVKVITARYSKPDALEAAIYAPPGQQMPGVLIQASYLEDQSGDCAPETGDYLLIWAVPNGDSGYTLQQQNRRCEPQAPFHLSTTTGQSDFITLMEACSGRYCPSNTSRYADPPYQEQTWYQLDWVQLQSLGFPHNAKTVFELVDALQAQVLQDIQPAVTRQDIRTLLAYLPADDPTATEIKQQLQYLLGLSYELSGLPARAIENYSILIDLAPESVWSRLALSRLAPNPASINP